MRIILSLCLILITVSLAANTDESLALDEAWRLLMETHEDVQRFRQDDYQAAVTKRGTLVNYSPLK